MTQEVIETKTIKRVRQITLNRPDSANAFNTEMRTLASQALLEAGADDQIGAVVLTGAGKSFSAGIDLRELASLVGGDMGGHSPETAASQGGQADGPQGQAGDTHSHSQSSADSWNFLQVLQDFPKPLIMAVNGAAVGLGTTMLGYADLVFASELARFKCPFTELGVGAEAASTWLLPKLMGWQNAMWLLLSSEWVDAAQAKELGLVFQVGPHATFLYDAIAVAQAIASKDLAASIAIKQTMTAWRKQPVADAIKSEGEAFMELIAAKQA